MYQNFYFTFGSAAHFPFSQNEFIMIQAANETIAHNEFRKHYKDYTEGVANYAFLYNQKEWNQIYPKHYAGKEPSERIFVRNVSSTNLTQEEINEEDYVYDE